MILGHLRSTRGDIASLAVNADALTTRVGLLEEHVAGLPRDLALIHGDMAAMSQPPATIRDASNGSKSVPSWPIRRLLPLTAS